MTPLFCRSAAKAAFSIDGLLKRVITQSRMIVGHFDGVLNHTDRGPTFPLILCAQISLWLEQ